MKNVRAKYVLVMYFGRKSNLGRQINSHKKLYQIFTNLFLLANITTPGQVGKNFTYKLKRILYPVTFVVDGLALGRAIYLFNNIITSRYMLTNLG